MSKYTEHYNLFEYDTTTDGKEKFKIKNALNDNFDIIDSALHEIDSKADTIGNLSALNTVDKDNVVAAINESLDFTNSLQQDVLALTTRNRIADVVDNYTALESYGTSGLSSNSIVIVLHDNNHDNALSFYAWEGVYDGQGAISSYRWTYKLSLDTFYTKAEINALMTSLYTYKGTVAKVADLPSSNNKTGDTYNVASTGANYTWDGEGWDKLSETAVVTDLTNYYNKSETDTLLNAKASTATTDSLASNISSLSTITDSAKVLITSLLSPSNVYDELTLESSTFVAPSNGYYSLVQEANAPGEQVKIVNAANGMTDIGVCFSAGIISANLYVGKGQSVTITSTATGNIESFRFIYALGSVSEKPIVEEPQQEPEPQPPIEEGNQEIEETEEP